MGKKNDAQKPTDEEKVEEQVGAEEASQEKVSEESSEEEQSSKPKKGMSAVQLLKAYKIGASVSKITVFPKEGQPRVYTQLNDGPLWKEIAVQYANAKHGSIVQE